MHGLNQYDYIARYYDLAIRRFTSVDPLAEKYSSISIYVYVANNPMRLIDWDGKDWRDVLAGYGIGILTNTLPYSSNLRDTYTPNSFYDYNHALEAVDNASMIMGTVLTSGGAAISSGGSAIITTGGVLSRLVALELLKEQLLLVLERLPFLVGLC